MNGLLYYVCLVALLPLVGFAAFGALIDSLQAFGFWEVFKLMTAPLWDPLGRGLWIWAVLATLGSLIVAGTMADWRPYGFGALAVLGIGCAAYILRSFPGPWEWGHLLVFGPSLAGVALSVYSCFRR